MHNAPASFRLYLQLTAVSVIWGGTFIAGRLLAGSVPPLLAASLRFTIASIVLLVFLALARTPLRRPDCRQAMRLLLLGFFGIFSYNLCFFYGLHLVSAARASLIVSLNPAMIALASYVLLKEALPPVKLTGVVLCLAGAGLVIVGKNGSALTGNHALGGDMLILGCVASWVIYSVGSRGLSQSLGSLHTVTWSILLGTAMLWAATCAQGSVNLAAIIRLSPTQWACLFYLGALGSALAYIWYYDGIKWIGATRSGAFIALNPLTAVLLGAGLLREQLTSSMIVGGILAIIGIVLCNCTTTELWRTLVSFPKRSPDT